MNNSIKRIISCCLVIVLLNSIVGCGRSNVTDESINGEQFAFTMIDKISDCSETIFNPLMQEPSYIDSKLSIQDNGLDYTNYWVQTIIAITKMYKEGDYEYAKNVIAREMHTFDEYGYFPRPEYTVFPYGWVSSMDAPVIAVASQMLYEHTGETIYVDFVDRLSNYILQDTKHHGFYCDVSDGIWMFEYANHDTSEDNAEFVLNGSLFGTLCTLLIADVTNNQKLKSLISNQVRIYKQYAPQYEVE